MSFAWPCAHKTHLIQLNDTLCSPYFSVVVGVTDRECSVLDSRYHEGSCYKVHTDPQTWTSAETACSTHLHGGHLATVANNRAQGE